MVINMDVITNQTFDAERALYASSDITVDRCRFDGPADGESAMKESHDLLVKNSFFNLRYPFWHDDRLIIESCELTELCRAALWYTNDVKISDSKLHGIKALRECSGIHISDCDIISPEFGWFSHGIRMERTSVTGEYFMLRSTGLEFSDVTLKGKYSFQYVDGGEINNCDFQTKDAFWHCHNVTIRNSRISGEYFSWYSNGLTLINCEISGTQPLCYCNNLRLINCRMIDTDLSFEKSDVDATLTAPIVSIKNPASGTIRVPEVGEIIMDDGMAAGRIILTK